MYIRPYPVNPLPNLPKFLIWWRNVRAWFKKLFISPGSLFLWKEFLLLKDIFTKSQVFLGFYRWIEINRFLGRKYSKGWKNFFYFFSLNIGNNPPPFDSLPLFQFEIESIVHYRSSVCCSCNLHHCRNHYVLPSSN